MTIQQDTDGILDLLTCPGFCARDNLITRVNQAAAAMLLSVGTDVRSLLATGSEDYDRFDTGCLYLKLQISGEDWDASVLRRDGTDYFLLDPPSQEDALRALSLAASALRSTMTGVIASADQLSEQLDPANEKAAEQLARMNRGLYRTLRLIGNMSDAEGWCRQGRQEIREIGSLAEEIFEKAAALAEASGVRIVYEGLQEDIYTLTDRDQLERAVLNILSNAMKVSPPGGTVEASLRHRGRLLRLTVQDQGPGIPDTVRGTLFSRYLRQSGIEDSRFGLGLGMVLIRSAAAAHGGTVLVDHPETGGTRVTLTLAIRQDQASQLRSPLLRPDYAGCRDHALLELSDCLPPELYKV